MDILSTQDIILAVNNLAQIPDKTKWKTTTSKIFKLSLLQYLNNRPKMSWVELGAAQGHTTHVLSCIAKNVLSVDRVEENCAKIRNFKHQNVEVISLDLYGDNFSKLMSNSNFDAAIIDAIHETQNVLVDIENCKLANVKLFVFDDYGAFKGVKAAVDSFILDLESKNIDHRVTFAGMPPGSYFPNTGFKILQDWEGIIVELND